MLYSVVVKGEAFSQEITNILYYRESAGMEILNQVFGNADILGDAVMEGWVDKVLPCLPNVYRAVSVSVYPHNELFQLVSQLPITGFFPADTLGEIIPEGMNGPAPVCNIRFNLKPTNALMPDKPPKTGYIAFGPLSDLWIGNNGYLNVPANKEADWNAMLQWLGGQLISILPPGQFIPIRVRHNRELMGLKKWLAYADVRDCAANPRTSWRRSRMPE
jgi:hypothetical protein